MYSSKTGPSAAVTKDGAIISIDFGTARGETDT